MARRFKGKPGDQIETSRDDSSVSLELLSSRAEVKREKFAKFNGKPGDPIEIHCGLYQHWAVYIRENEVVHFTTDGVQSSGSFKSLSSSTGMVKCEKFTNVVKKHVNQVNNLLDDLYKARDPSIIVMEACEMVGREPKYDLDTYNSKHFATEMRYGKAESRQCKGNKGDLIEIFRGSYQDWAVYIGENEVVHFTTDGVQSSGSFEVLSISTGKVKCEKFTDVVGRHHHHINNLLDKKYEAHDPSIIVKEACEMVGKKLKYSVVSYNSEHFATEMRYGVAESRQVKIKTWLADFGGAAAALVIGGPGAAVGGPGAAVAGSVVGRQLRSRSRSKEEIYPF